MPALRYEIAADEAWTHTGLPLNRYWCFFGGIFGPEADCGRLETALRDVLSRHKVKGEVKWSAVTGHNLAAYKELVDVFCDQIAKHNLTYRQLFLDRSYVHVPSPGDPPRSNLDLQFLICYQFLKYSFGLKFLSEEDPARDFHVTIRLDTHSSQPHKEELTKHVESLPKYLRTPRLTTSVQFVNSKRFLRLQLCDLMMGAAGSYGNRMHERREPGKRGMTPKQKWRLEIAKHIYWHLRSLDAAERGSKAFNWFESTGTLSDARNRLAHKIRIWKFIPRNSVRDKWWLNKQLDSQGRYVGPTSPPIA